MNDMAEMALGAAGWHSQWSAGVQLCTFPAHSQLASALTKVKLCMLWLLQPICHPCDNASSLVPLPHADSRRASGSKPASSAPVPHHPRPQQQQQQQQQARSGVHGLSIRQQRQRQQEQQAEELRRQGEIMSHEQVLSAARQEEEEVPNIDGVL